MLQSTADGGPEPSSDQNSVLSPAHSLNHHAHCLESPQGCPNLIAMCVSDLERSHHHLPTPVHTQYPASHGKAAWGPPCTLEDPPPPTPSPHAAPGCMLQTSRSFPCLPAEAPSRTLRAGKRGRGGPPRSGTGTGLPSIPCIRVALSLDQSTPLGARALCCTECACVLWRGVRRGGLLW